MKPVKIRCDGKKKDAEECVSVLGDSIIHAMVLVLILRDNTGSFSHFLAFRRLKYDNGGRPDPRAASSMLRLQ